MHSPIEAAAVWREREGAMLLCLNTVPATLFVDDSFPLEFSEVGPDARLTMNFLVTRYHVGAGILGIDRRQSIFRLAHQEAEKL